MFNFLNRLMPWRRFQALINDERILIEQQIALANLQMERLDAQAAKLDHVVAILVAQNEIVGRVDARVEAAEERGFSSNQLSMLSHRVSRNFLPNDGAAVQKLLMAVWRSASNQRIHAKDLQSSGFRVFSQNDEDGVVLRIFSQIGTTNRYVIEVGSNCNGSDIGIPENISTNLIVNHGWHGAVFELDPVECARIRHFFARDYATKHFHIETDSLNGYYSPIVIQQEITPGNIDRALTDASEESEPDLMIVDIDGGDYAVVQAVSRVQPRVIVVEFEKRFRDRHSVIQPDRTNFSARWSQSGTVSLPAWIKLLGDKGYSLCAIGSCGFNAFFVRSDIAHKSFVPLSAEAAFEEHPIFSKMPEEFWVQPDHTWQET
jgi:hypothetical protein